MFFRFVGAALAGLLAINTQVSAAEGSTQWSYSGKNGPDHWGDLSADYELCKTGHLQSPIDVTDGAGANFKGLAFHYAPTEIETLNNGHTIQVSYAPGSALMSGNKSYELLQFHFHSPSEHAVDGSTYPMEAHFVHKAQDGTLAVVGVMFKAGAHNDALQPIWDHMPRRTGETIHGGNTLIDATALLPSGHNFARYIGSLTTPPCSENVQWHVMKEPIEASQDQINVFRSVVQENARPLQPVGDRIVLDSVGGTRAAADHSSAADSHSTSGH